MGVKNLAGPQWQKPGWESSLQAFYSGRVYYQCATYTVRILQKFSRYIRILSCLQSLFDKVYSFSSGAYSGAYIVVYGVFVI